MPSEQLNVYIGNQECTSNSSSFQGMHKMLNYLEMSSEHLEYMSCGMMCIFWSVSKFNTWSSQAWESLVHSSVQGSFQAVHSLLSCCVDWMTCLQNQQYRRESTDILQLQRLMNLCYSSQCQLKKKHLWSVLAMGTIQYPHHIVSEYCRQIQQ